MPTTPEHSSNAFVYLKMAAKPRKALSCILSRPITDQERRISIKKMTIDDLEGFVELHNRSFMAAPDPFRELTLEGARKLLDEDTVFLATLFGKLVGFVVIVIYDYENETNGEIASIGTLPNRRRAGVATALIRSAAAFLDDKGIQRVVCEVYEKNSPSYALISSHGFKEVGERVIPKDGTPEELEKATRTWKLVRSRS